jgi:polyisoprenyl-phosphate glycosyltransferase
MEQTEAAPAASKRVDIVVPIYNEQEILEAFYTRLCKAVEKLPYSFHFVFINDGSTDRSQESLERLAANDERMNLLELSRNFGHQAALTAGLDLSSAQRSDFVITLDGDGEHPPEMIEEMLSLAEEGFEVVLAQRTEDQQASRLKRWTSSSFYSLINIIGNTNIHPGAADFRLLSRVVVDALQDMREYHRFLRGMVPWMGFRTAILPYSPGARMGGKSKYSLRKMVSLALNAIFSFSLIPLYIAISLGGLFLVLAVLEAFYVLSFWVSGQESSLAPGWSSLMFMLLVIGGTVMVSLGMIGIYIGYIFQEVKRRPIYLVRKISAVSSQPGREQPAECASTPKAGTPS